MVSVQEILQVVSDSDTPPDPDEPRLPKHERCAAHTLNLIATVDAERALQDVRYRRAFTRVMNICKALWNKQQHSSIASEAVQRHLGRFLILPCATRWNSLFKALDQIREEGATRINKVLDALNVSRILGDDLVFLEEYTSVC